jgi:hypothetical protein
MRMLLLVSAVAIACSAAAPLASAMGPPPIGLNGIRIVKLTPQKQQKSCSVQTRKRTGAGRVARKILPVACEQPPRSKVLDAGFVILFAP